MDEYRNNPEGPENTETSKQAERGKFALQMQHKKDTEPTETTAPNPSGSEVWSESEIPYAVAERIVIERLKAEVKKHNLEWLESIALEVKRGGSNSSDLKLEASYVLWVGSQHRGFRPTLEESIAVAIRTPEQKRMDAIAAAQKKKVEAEAALAELLTDFEK